MGNVVAALVGAIVMFAGLAFAGFLYTVGPPGIETLALAGGFGGGIAVFGGIVCYLGLFSDRWQDGNASIHIGGPRR